ncbi:MAG TPA: sulfatase [Pseudomonadales bacterium]|nr:sulfatase [Pseudomonadales bacterium]
MRIRVFLPMFLLLCSTLLGAWPAVAQAVAPNFVVIIADDLGALDVGAFGHPVIKTPNIDQLAKNGLQFNNAFLTTSSCSASRSSILTGLYPHSTGAQNLHDPVPADRKLVSSYLRDAGYYTAAIGKWHSGDPVKSQFDVVKDPPGDSGAEGWVDALQKRPKNKPFFFWLASRDPHVPYSDLTPDGPYQPKDAVILPIYFDAPGARQNIAQYYTEISRLDSYVGRVVDELKTQGLLDNTYIIFLSDNGAPMPRAKTTLYDAGIKTPLIISGPHITAGSKTDALVSSVDLAPTMLALTGIKKPDAMQGLEFSMLLANPQKPFRDMIFAEQHDHGFPINKQAVRSNDYLYIHNIGENKTNCILEVQPMGKELQQAFVDKKLTRDQAYCFVRNAPPEELYDVKQDPLQLNNLAADPAKDAVKAEMKKKLDAQVF